MTTEMQKKLVINYLRHVQCSEIQELSDLFFEGSLFYAHRCLRELKGVIKVSKLAETLLDSPFRIHTSLNKGFTASKVYRLRDIKGLNYSPAAAETLFLKKCLVKTLKQEFVIRRSIIHRECVTVNTGLNQILFINAVDGKSISHIRQIIDLFSARKIIVILPTVESISTASHEILDKKIGFIAVADLHTVFTISRIFPIGEYVEAV